MPDDAAGSGGGSGGGGGGSGAGMESASAVPALIEALVAADRMVKSVMAFRTELIEAVRVASLLPHVDGALDVGRRDIAPSEDELAARAAMITEMSCALRVPEGTMDSLVDQAQVLLTTLPATAAAMRDGTISYRHVQVMIEQLEGLDARARARIEDRLVPKAKVLSVARFKNHARRERERVDPVPVGVRHERATTGRRVHLEHADDGVSWLHALLPSTVATAAFNRISAVAASLKDPVDGRTLPQLRADILGTLLVDDDAREALRTFHDAAARAGHSGTSSAGTSSAGTTTAGTATGTTTAACGCFPDSDRDPAGAGAARSSGSGAAGSLNDESGGDAGEAARRRQQLRQALRRIQATVAVTVPVLTLLGEDAPAELEGYGPIDAETARELCAGASSFMRILTHPHSGAVMGVDRDRYSPPADLRAALRLRDQHCRFPGCPRAAQRCDLDHVIDWAKGGLTDQANLIHLCRRHHRLRHTTGWEAEIITHLLHTGGPTQSDNQPLGARVEWTSPAGRTYTTHDAYSDRHDPGPIPGRSPTGASGDAGSGDAGSGSGSGDAAQPNWVWYQHAPGAQGSSGTSPAGGGEWDFVPAHVPVRTSASVPDPPSDTPPRCVFPDIPPF